MKNAWKKNHKLPKIFDWKKREVGWKRWLEKRAMVVEMIGDGGRRHRLGFAVLKMSERYIHVLSFVTYINTDILARVTHIIIIFKNI